MSICTSPYSSQPPTRPYQSQFHTNEHHRLIFFIIIVSLPNDRTALKFCCYRGLCQYSHFHTYEYSIPHTTKSQGHKQKTVHRTIPEKQPTENNITNKTSQLKHVRKSPQKTIHLLLVTFLDTWLSVIRHDMIRERQRQWQTMKLRHLYVIINCFLVLCILLIVLVCLSPMKF